MTFHKETGLRALRGVILSLLGLCFLQGVVWADPNLNDPYYEWKTLDEDGLHDPTNPSIYQKQNPEEAFSTLPLMPTGNQVDWVRAINDGDIDPRTSISGGTRVQPVLDMDVILDHTADLPMVRFPHKAHTEWLDCSNCHDWLFKQKGKATNFGMFDILNGEFCGRCHGAVAFPLTNCYRCHSVYRTPNGLRPERKTRRGVFKENGY
jgi:c(7)-type cytochrome triheme protein